MLIKFKGLMGFIQSWIINHGSHDCKDYEIRTGTHVSPMSAWGDYGVPIDLTCHDENEKLDVYRCVLCGEARYQKYVPYKVEAHG